MTSTPERVLLYGLLRMLVIWYELGGLVANFQPWFKRPVKQVVAK